MRQRATAKLRRLWENLMQSVRTHAQKTSSWIKAIKYWLWESRFFWLAFVVVAAPIVASFCWPHEYFLRYAGLFLQFLGILTVAWGIWKTRELFGHPSFLMRIREWLRRFPPYGGRTMTASARAVVTGAASARASVRRGIPPNATLEQRIEVLERNLQLVDDELSQTQKEVEEGLRKRSDAIEREAKIRAQSDQELRERLTATATGGLDISAMGALWLLVGVIMSTIPAELAGLLQLISSLRSN
jgi:hypothetical protein